jgi:hypothetical protein
VTQFDNAVRVTLLSYSSAREAGTKSLVALQRAASTAIVLATFFPRRHRAGKFDS